MRVRGDLGALLLVYFPLILAKAPASYVATPAARRPDYLARWLVISAGLFVRRLSLDDQGRTIRRRTRR